MLVVPNSTAFKSRWWDKSKLEASGTAVGQWVKQAKSKDANEDALNVFYVTPCCLATHLFSRWKPLGFKVSREGEKNASKRTDFISSNKFLC
nr:hypothetical protein CFP56_61770 [Quercus suber]